MLQFYLSRKVKWCVHQTICPMILQRIVQCLFNLGYQTSYGTTLYLSLYSLYLLVHALYFYCSLTVCCLFSSPICFSICYWHLVTLLHGLYHTHFSVFIHAIHWRTWWLKQTYIVLHAASFSSWIDITNHKGKHWTKLILLCGSAFQLLLNFCFIE